MSLSALEKFKAKLEIEQTSTPLWVYLYIYHKSKGCYISYMEGAIALYEFLAPIEIPDCYDEEQLPEYLFGYETDQIATILSGYKTLEHLGQLHKIENAIIHTTIKELMPRLQEGNKL